MRVKTILKYLGLVLLGLLLGGLWAVYQLNQVKTSTSFQLENGAWRVNPSMDLSKNTFQRALVSRIGLFALRESEVLYYVARTDENGDPLSSAYDYEIVGNALDARYWSFTLYGEDFFLVPNDTKQYGYNMENMVYEDSTQSSYRIRLSSREQYDNWLPAGKEKQLTITLRMYNPDPTVVQNLASVALPIIRKIEPK
ncbi:MAG: DUF1214 domain-containing protein [Bacteroidota bacterium]